MKEGLILAKKEIAKEAVNSLLAAGVILFFATDQHPLRSSMDCLGTPSLYLEPQIIRPNKMDSHCYYLMDPNGFPVTISPVGWQQ